MSGDSVECPRCGNQFELWASGGYCTNPDCGAQHPEAKSDTGGGNSDDMTDDADTTGDAGEVNDPGTGDGGGGADTIKCDNCGAEVGASFAFCNQCGSELTQDDGRDTGGTDDGMVTCPNCGSESSAELAFCADCGTELPDAASGDGTSGGGGQSTPDQPDQTTPAGASGGGDPNVEIDIAGERMSIAHGDVIGGEVREALVANGTDRDEARYIHREHIEFEMRDDGVYVVDHGRNTTEVDGQSLSEGDEAKVSDGSTITLSDIATLDVHIT